MAIRSFLAMTAAEMGENSVFPPETAWMACHFSPYGTGLSNLPEDLPPGSLLILNDRTPIHGHDPERIGAQLAVVLESLECAGLLLDLQRPGVEETAALVQYLLRALPCPVVVSEPYARELDCPVFLPPAPLDGPLTDHLAPWQGRDIWLELALDGAVLTLTDQGAAYTPLPFGEGGEGSFSEETLHCHYRVQTTEDAARFTLWRTAEDLEGLKAEAEQLGVTACVGLYQELHDFTTPKPSSGRHVKC